MTTTPAERGGASLAEALLEGEGVERPFRCTAPGHIDEHASASVNVLKRVWYCYACGAKGKIDSRTVPTADELLAMLDPEQATRVYPEQWLDWFGHGYYWATRFPDWLTWLLHLGQDPTSGDATFPVHTPEGRLAGVGRRREDQEPRYLYPRSWSASRSLFTGQRDTDATGILVVVEGAADASSIIELGIDGRGCYGADLHYPQRELIARSGAKLVILGYDNDPAGHKGRDRARHTLNDLVETVDVDWGLYGAKDPAALTPDRRHELITDAVRASHYRPNVDVNTVWAAKARQAVDAYTQQGARP